MAPPRMTKQELREDPVLETIQKGLTFARTYSRWIVLGVIAIVVLIAVGVMSIQGRRAAEERAALELARARTQVFAGQVSQALTSLQNIVTRDGGTEAATEAHLLLGDVYLRLGQPAEAKTSFEEALRGIEEPVTKAGAVRGLAAALEGLGSKAEASIHYESAAGEAKTASDLNDLMNAARTAADAGDLARARSLYERCLAVAEEVARGRVSEVQSALAELDARTAVPGTADAGAGGF